MTHAKQIHDCIVRQTDHDLPWPVRRYGCRAMTLLAIPQFVTGKCLTIDQVKSLLDRGRETPRVIVSDKMMCGPDEHLLINWAFMLLGVNRRGRQVGWLPEHKTTVQWEYMIKHWRTDGQDGHFTLHDRNGVLLYDPHEPPLPMYAVNRELYYRTWGVDG